MALKKKIAKPQPKPSKAKSSQAAKPKPSAKPAAGKAAAKSAPAPAPAAGKRKSSWLSDSSNQPLIDKYARQLRSFMKAMADGRIDDSELEEQEQRLVALMKEVEPQLDSKLHPKVTELLCELTAYDLMRMLHSLNANRPKTVFQG